jgi:hypothetical protein
VPWLADSHTVSADGLTWEFKLKSGAKFHDGSPVAASDGPELRAIAGDIHKSSLLSGSTASVRREAVMQVGAGDVDRHHCGYFGA